MYRIFFLFLCTVFFCGCVVRQVGPDNTPIQKQYAKKLEEKSYIEIIDKQYGKWGGVPFMPLRKDEAVLISSSQRCKKDCSYNIIVNYNTCTDYIGYFDGYHWVASFFSLTLWPLKKDILCSGEVLIKDNKTLSEESIQMQFHVNVLAGLGAIVFLYNPDSYSSRLTKLVEVFADFEEKKNSLNK